MYPWCSSHGICTHGVVLTEYVLNVSVYTWHRVIWYLGSSIKRNAGTLLPVMWIVFAQNLISFFVPDLYYMREIVVTMFCSTTVMTSPHTRFCSEQWVTVWLVILQAIIFVFFASSKQFKLKPWNFLNQVTFQTDATSTYCTTVLTPIVACQQVCLWRLLSENSS